MKNYIRTLFLYSLFLSYLTGFGQTKVMTYNIRFDNPDDGENAWEFRKNELIDLLKFYNPDFLGIQEALPNQIQTITENIEEYDHIGHGRDGLDTNSEGVPLFYNKKKFKLLESDIFWLSETPKKPSKGWDAAFNRIAVYGAFENLADGDTIYLINCHFDHLGKMAREKSAEQLVNFIDQKKLSENKVIVMGDFNSLPEEKPIKMLNQYLEDSYYGSKKVAYGPIGTYNDFNIEKRLTERIDYIFTQNIDVKSYRSIDDKRKNNLYPSDHLPILIKL